MRPPRALVAGTVALLAGLGTSLIVSGGDATTSAGTPAPHAEDATTAPPTTARREPVHALGDHVAAGDLRLVLHSVTDPFESRDRVVTAPAGTRWIATDVEVTNLSRQVVTLSAQRQLSLRDATNARFGLADTVDDLPPLDGPLAAGETRRAVIVFQVPEGARNLRLAVTGAPGAPGRVQISLG